LIGFESLRLNRPCTYESRALKILEVFLGCCRFWVEWMGEEHWLHLWLWDECSRCWLWNLIFPYGF